jgi:hypothetical protein
MRRKAIVAIAVREQTENEAKKGKKKKKKKEQVCETEKEKSRRRRKKKKGQTKLTNKNQFSKTFNSKFQKLDISFSPTQTFVFLCVV